jgi:AraC-like DNA-binding protein
MIFKLTALDILLLVAAVQLVLFISFLLFGNRRRLPNMLLAAFLFAQLTMVLTGLSLGHQAFFIRHLPHLFLISAPFYTLAGPILYLYVRSLTEQDFRLYGSRLLHLAPFALSFLYFAAAFYLRGAEWKRGIMESGGFWTQDQWNTYRLAYYAQILVYCTASLRAIAHYRNRLKDQYSSVDRINLSWLRIVIIGYIAAWIFDVFRFAALWLRLEVPVDLLLLDFGAFIVFFNVIFFKGWTQPRIFVPESRLKYQSSTLTPDSADAYKARLDAHMREHRSYLNPDLTLKDLADATGIPPRHLSQVLNDRIRQNFFDYIGRLRVEESLRLFAEAGRTRKTVLEIVYEVGFNSKSTLKLPAASGGESSICKEKDIWMRSLTPRQAAGNALAIRFNSLFKKHIGMTPREYRRQLFQQKHHPDRRAR